MFLLIKTIWNIPSRKLHISRTFADKHRSYHGSESHSKPLCPAHRLKPSYPLRLLHTRLPVTTSWGFCTRCRLSTIGRNIALLRHRHSLGREDLFILLHQRAAATAARDQVVVAVVAVDAALPAYRSAPGHLYQALCGVQAQAESWEAHILRKENMSLMRVYQAKQSIVRCRCRLIHLSRYLCALESNDRNFGDTRLRDGLCVQRCQI